MQFAERLSRLFFIQRVFFTYAIDELLVELTGSSLLKQLCKLFPRRWRHRQTRCLPRGERLRRALEELGPVFIKFGQMLSTRRDLLPDDIAVELARLQDKVAPFASAEAIMAIEESLAQPVSQLFQTFEDQPLAAASIAQVHAARLHSGEDVVVKVLRPGIAKIIGRDVALMYSMASLVRVFWSEGRRLRPTEVVAEYEKTIYNELDMQREAASAALLRRNMADLDEIYVPEVYWEYTRDRVLVLERVHGIPISDVETLRGIGVDMKKLAERGVNIFFTQVFRDNFFHADMHPGNIFVSRALPHDPQYIAVDFGIVGSLTEQDRHYLSQNLLAFFDRDYHRVAQLHVDSGWVPADTRVEEFEAAIRTVCEPIFDKPLAEISFGQVLLRLFQTARQFSMEVQPQLVLLQKTLLNIEGLGRELYPQLDLWQTAKPILKNWMLERSGPRAVLQEVRNNLPEWGRMAPQLPGLVHQFLSTQAIATDESTQQQRLALQQGRAIVCSIAGGALLLTAVLIALLASEHHWRLLWLPLGSWCAALAALLIFRKAFSLTEIDHKQR